MHAGARCGSEISSYGRQITVTGNHFRRLTRHAGLRPAPDRVRRHHPDHNKLETQGWKALDAEGKPFVGVDGSGRRLHLLRVETESITDVGAVAPLLGGEGVRYDPLPARLVSQRRRLAFVYHDGRSVERLDFAEARRLTDQSAASRFALEADA
jgi:hypothetical protein